EKRAEPSPVRLIVLRYCLGMIMSVSTLMIGIGAATPVSWLNFSTADSPGARHFAVGLYRATATPVQEPNLSWYLSLPPSCAGACEPPPPALANKNQPRRPA